MIRRSTSHRYITQRNFKIAVVVAGAALIIGFFTYQFKFLRAPALKVSLPDTDITVESDFFDVRGRTDPDADLTLNGRPLYSGETGEFTERIYLVPGVNRLDFEAKNRYGKTATLIRYIVVR